MSLYVLYIKNEMKCSSGFTYERKKVPSLSFIISEDHKEEGELVKTIQLL